MKKIGAFEYTEKNKFFLVQDSYNKSRAEKYFTIIDEELNLVKNSNEADCFIVIGGDGSLLNAIRKYGELKKPIFAINAGTIGKNLLDIKIEDLKSFINNKIKTSNCYLFEFPMLEVIATDENDNIYVYKAFQDMFIDRQDASTVRYELSVDTGEENIPITEGFISGDGVLVANPMGSTGYARLLSEIVFPLNGDSILVSPMASMINSNKRKLHSFALSKGNVLNIKFLDINFRKNRLAVEGKYVKKGSAYLNFKKIRVYSSLSDKIILISDNQANFTKKQLDFIARG